MNNFIFGKYSPFLPIHIESKANIKLPIQKKNLSIVKYCTFIDNQCVDINGNAIEIPSGIYRIICMDSDDAIKIGSSCIVLDDQLGVEWTQQYPKSSKLFAFQERIKVLNVDFKVNFNEHMSVLDAFRFQALKQINRHWGSNSTIGDERFFRSINDHPWQEVRQSFNFEKSQGYVLDINSAYGSIMSNERYPSPDGIEYVSSIDDADLILCEYKSKSLFSYYWNQFLYSDTKKGYVNLKNQIARVWVIKKEYLLLKKYGEFKILKMMRFKNKAEHPLKNALSVWNNYKHNINNDAYKKLWKLKISTAHSFTWSPRIKYLENVDDWFLINYQSPPFFNKNHNINENKVIDEYNSGWYLPIMWTRLNIRYLMSFLIEQLFLHNIEICYINIDGVHIKHNNHSDINHIINILSEHGYTLRIDKTFDAGIWASPGFYGLLNDNKWENTSNFSMLNNMSLDKIISNTSIMYINKNKASYIRSNNLELFNNFSIYRGQNNVQLLKKHILTKLELPCLNKM